MKSLPLPLAAAWLLLCAPFLPGQTANPSPAAMPLRAFHIGNSLTYGVVNDPNHRNFMSGNGVDYKPGYHVLWGQSLATIWDKADAPSATVQQFGNFKNALEKSDWDVLTLQELVAKLNEDLPDLRKPVKLIPAGTVLAAIDQQIREGKLTGIQKIEQLYKDDIHLTPLGNYIVRCTFYAVLRNESPQGRPGTELFKDVSPESGNLIQDTVWRVVSAMQD